ncbi:collagen binding domain-containing protein [Streptomyces sp. AC495_CC817]|uniref:MSCRAMM family protein n=1 Tax=Streptomyces sp. AC495_CC817 TaxID=2823900 RepID=UPI001C2690E8|nr:SpaA isopeptide-forming pilin-related protein [Streptomyces sp. AC495_CC817]
MNTPSITRQAPRRTARAVVAALAGIIVAIATILVPGLGASAPAAASTSFANQAVRGLQTWYIYVAPGEEPSVQFYKIAATTGGWGPNTNIVVRDPNNAIAYSCAINSTTTPNSTLLAACNYAPLSIAANQAGVWSVAIEQGAGTTAPTQNLGQNRMNWTIGTRDTAISALKPGRVWTEMYVSADEIADYNAGRQVTMTLFYQTPEGFTYRTVRQGLAGIDAAFTANAFGVVDPATCSSAHRSRSTNGADPYRPVTATSCPFTPHKIFFEAPAADLPATVTLPGGRTTWLRTIPPAPDEITVAASFVPSAPGARSGSIELTATKFEGSVSVDIDVDDDGLFTGPADRTIAASIVAGRVTTVPFDGLDRNGAAISTLVPLAVRVTVERMGEVHFVDSDVEVLSGGIVVERINGPTAGRYALSWNDSAILSGLPSGEQKCSTTTTVTGDAVDSSASVHRWGLGTCTTSSQADPRYFNTSPAQAAAGGYAGTWGNLAEIDHWTAVPVQRAFAAEVPAFRIAKSATPATATNVAPGDRVDYRIDVSPIRYAHPPTAAGLVWTPATVWSGRFTDALADVADNADVDWPGIAATPAAGSTVSVDQAASRFSWTGQGIPVQSSVAVTYSAKVKATLPQNSDLDLHNIAYVHTGSTPPTPPTQCLAGLCGTTTHPIGTGDLRLKKTDAAGGAALRGATFQLWRDTDADGVLNPASDTTVGAPRTTDGGGSIVWTGLVWGRYLVQETAAPAGYALVDPVVRSVRLGAGGIDLAIENTRLPGAVTWRKVADDAAGTALAGSEWTLQRAGGSARAVTDCVTSPCTGPDTDPAPGSFRVDDLEWGAYVLREVKAPAGYVLDASPHEFTVSATALQIGIGAVVNSQQPPLQLPFTGGTSADAYALLGLGSGAVAGILFLVRRLARRRTAR